MTKSDLQTAINILVDIHENESQKMAEVLGTGCHKEMQRQIANIARYLMIKRDGEIDN